MKKKTYKDFTPYSVNPSLPDLLRIVKILSTTETDRGICSVCDNPAIKITKFKLDGQYGYRLYCELHSWELTIKNIENRILKDEINFENKKNERTSI